MKLNPFKQSVFLVLVTALVCCLGPSCSRPDPYADAPPVPPGYKTHLEAQAAVLTGQVPAIKPPETVPAGITEHKDIEYGNAGGDRPLLLDLYVPDNLTKPAPALIFINGGGWMMGNKADYRYYVIEYAKKGYVTASISYRLSGEAKFPAAVQDAKCAVRWMRANAAKYKADSYKIAVIGGSAGGHLSLMLGYSDDPALEGDAGYAEYSSRVQAVVNFYGVVDCTTEYGKGRQEPITFIGKTYDEAPELWEQNSPIFHLTADDPPTLTFHGTIDELVPVAQADTLHAKLDELGINNRLDKFEGWPHTMDLAEPVNTRCQFMMDRFFEQHIPLP